MGQYCSGGTPAGHHRQQWQQRLLCESLNVVMQAKGCKANITSFNLSETHLHDGKPLPQTDPNCPPRAWTLSDKLASDYVSPSRRGLQK